MLILDMKSKINVKLNKLCHLKGNFLQGFKGTAFLVDKQEHAQAFRGFSHLIKRNDRDFPPANPLSICCITTWHPGVSWICQIVPLISQFVSARTAGVFRECGDVNTSVAHSKPPLPLWFVLIEAEEICYAV